MASSLYFDSAATALAVAQRDGNGDLAARKLATTALGGFDNLGYERAGVYAFSGTITIDNSAVNGGIFEGTTGSGNYTVNLPAAAGVSGQVIEVVKVDSGTGTVIVDASGGELINGAITFTLRAQYESLRIRCNGVGWDIVGYYPGPTAPGSISTAIPDPGNGAAIPVTRSGYVSITSTGSDTRTLAAPTFVGQEIILIHAVDGGSVAVTVSAAFDASAHTILTATAVAASCRLVATLTGVTKRWALVYTDGFTAS